MLAKIVFFSFGKLQFNSSTNFSRWVFICPACVCVWEPTTMTFKKKSFWQQWYKSTFINSITLFIYLFLQSLGILASIPAAILIISLVGLLLYLLTRCCDREATKVQSQSCQKFTLISTTLFCCAAIGLGKYNKPSHHLLMFLFSATLIQVSNDIFSMSHFHYRIIN